MEDNKAVVRRFVDRVANGHDLTLVEELCAPDHVLYHPALPRIVHGTADFKRALGEVIWAPFPDHRLTVHEIIAEGDRVAIRMSVDATNTGLLNGVPAKGKRIEGTGIVVYRIAHGKIVESHIEEDILRMLFDLDLVPKNMTVLYWLKKLGVVWLLQRLGKIPSSSPLSKAPPAS
jgi:steroid delta-isomerase-like uncharacterized protein